MNKFFSLLGTVTVSSLFVATSLWAGSSRSQQPLKELTRIDPLSVNESDLFKLIQLPATDLPAVGKGSIKKTGETYEFFVNPLKYNSGLISPLAPIRTEGGQPETTPSGLLLKGVTVNFGGVKPSACKIPGLEITSSLCGATIKNVIVTLESTFQSENPLSFSIKPDNNLTNPTLLEFTDEVKCDGFPTRIVVSGQKNCTVNLSLALAEGKNIFKGSGTIK